MLIVVSYKTSGATARVALCEKHPTQNSAHLDGATQRTLRVLLRAPGCPISGAAVMHMTSSKGGNRNPHRLRIAQVAPLYESVPPKLYGGTERIVSYLTEELVCQGHEVTLFASGDSVTSAELVAGCERGLRLDPRQPDPCAAHVLMLERLMRRAGDFDVIHFHTEQMHLPLARRQAVPCLFTLHGRLDIAGLDALYREFRDIPLVAISNSQRSALPNARWVGTVYHGVPVRLHLSRDEPGQYLAFLGRISPDKRVDRAIEIARRAGIPLKIAAKVDAADREYFTKMIEPLIDGSLVQLVGEISDAEKTAFLGDALALVFPIDWPEPFGLAMIEAMACGTPVIAFRNGSVPEVIEEGVTGFIVDSVEQGVDAVARVKALNRRLCRQRFEARFSSARMAAEYCQIYQALRARRTHASSAGHHASDSEQTRPITGVKVQLSRMP